MIESITFRKRSEEYIATVGVKLDRQALDSVVVADEVLEHLRIT